MDVKLEHRWVALMAEMLVAVRVGKMADRKVAKMAAWRVSSMGEKKVGL